MACGFFNLETCELLRAFVSPSRPFPIIMEPFFSITVYGFVWYVPCSFFLFSVLFNQTVSPTLTFGFSVMFRRLSAYVFIFCFAALSFSLSSLSNVGVTFSVCGSLFSYCVQAPHPLTSGFPVVVRGVAR